MIRFQIRIATRRGRDVAAAADKVAEFVSAAAGVYPSVRSSVRKRGGLADLSWSISTPDPLGILRAILHDAEANGWLADVLADVQGNAVAVPGGRILAFITADFRERFDGVGGAF